MAEKKKKENKKEKKTNYFLYIILAAVIIVAVYLLFFQPKKEEFRLKTDPSERYKDIPEPQFVNQGELGFYRNGKEIKKIDIEVADNEKKRMQGLMYRKSMDDGKGMLFIFQNSELQSFWMKNTLIPLDIMYVSEDKEIVKIYKNTTPLSEKSLPSGKKAKYVVEVAGGFCDRYGVTEGDKIDFTLK